MEILIGTMVAGGIIDFTVNGENVGTRDKLYNDSMKTEMAENLTFTCLGTWGMR
jgi:hypothetical protein